jgi:beta-lactamase class D
MPALLRYFSLTILLAAPAAEPGPAPDTAPWVLVDYSVGGRTYRVAGDATLLSQRFTPGTTMDLLIAAAALESGQVTADTVIPVRGEPLSLPRALKEANEDFFAQLLKRTGYEPLRQFLIRSRYTPGIPDAVASFADLARGEPLRVTVFEQNLLLQSFVTRRAPLREEHCSSLERWLAVEAPRHAWGTSGSGEVSPEAGRVDWFNGAVRMKDGQHVITVAVVGRAPAAAALDRLRAYLGGKR